MTILSTERLVWSALGVAALIVVLAFLGNVRQLYAAVQEEGNCAAQIRQHAGALQVAKYAGDSDVAKKRVAQDIDCPTDYVTIEGYGKPVKEKLAQEMLSCWKRWDKGQTELFAQDNGVYCHVCDIVSFENEQEIPAFASYLASHPKNAEKTYLKQLNPRITSKIQNAITEVPERELSVLDTKKRHGIIFRFVKGKEALLGLFGEDTTQNTGMFVGTAVGAYAGAKVGGTVGSVACGWVPAFGLLCSGGGTAAGATLGAFAGFISSAKALSWLDFSGQQWYADVGVIPYDNESISEMGCQIVK